VRDRSDVDVPPRWVVVRPSCHRSHWVVCASVAGLGADPEVIVQETVLPGHWIRVPAGLHDGALAGPGAFLIGGGFLWPSCEVLKCPFRSIGCCQLRPYLGLHQSGGSPNCCRFTRRSWWVTVGLGGLLSSCIHMAAFESSLRPRELLVGWKTRVPQVVSGIPSNQEARSRGVTWGEGAPCMNKAVSTFRRSMVFILGVHRELVELLVMLLRGVVLDMLYGDCPIDNRHTSISFDLMSQVVAH